MGGVSGNKSAVKVALERRYKDYSQEGPLTQALVGEALKRLRHMAPAGPKDRLNVEDTIYQTTKNAGEIEIVFDRDVEGQAQGDSRHRQRRLVHGSLHPAGPDALRLRPVPVQGPQDLFLPQHHLRHPLGRSRRASGKPQRIEEFARLDPQTRLVIVGDASMAPYELLATDGSIYAEERSGQAEHRVPAISWPRPSRAASGSTPSRPKPGTTPAASPPSARSSPCSSSPSTAWSRRSTHLMKK
ncbi:MAG: hypothetical protein MZU95_00870 [Desulfomicrobium escambiense]|nr:hypothetical protein [Desulfomicrobium escambiense]